MATVEKIHQPPGPGGGGLRIVDIDMSNRCASNGSRRGSFSNSWQGIKRAVLVGLFLNGRLCRCQLNTKNRLELPVADRLELKLSSSFNLN